MINASDAGAVPLAVAVESLLRRVGINRRIRVSLLRDLTTPPAAKTAVPPPLRHRYWLTRKTAERIVALYRRDYEAFADVGLRPPDLSRYDAGSMEHIVSGETVVRVGL